MGAMVPGHSRPDWTRRLGQVEDAVRQHALDAVIISSPVNIRYLTGFSGSSGLLALSVGEARLIVDGRYQCAVGGAMASMAVAAMSIEPVAGSYAQALGAVVERSGWRRVGFEAAHVTVATLSAWQQQAAHAEWVRTDVLVERLRRIKDAYEQAVFRRAGRMLSEVASDLGRLVAVGRTELEVARAVDRALETTGFSAPAFPTIVASGPLSAHPHARPTDRRLSQGDLVLLDFGGVLDGYCVDLTRMAAVGAIVPELTRVFDAVREAQAAALSAVRPGVPAASIDDAARRVFAARGLEAAVLHSTGHGLGLEVHEAPRLSAVRTAGEDDVLAEGMVCTIEPGAYLEGLGGARLEDDVLVTASGYEALTTSPRDLLVV